MIPLGIIQSKGDNMVFVNFNGSYFEDTYPSTPSWPAGYNEIEYRYTTQNASPFAITSAPTISIPKLGLSLFGMYTTSGNIGVYNTHNLGNTDRILRAINTPPLFYIEMQISGFSLGNKYKFHFYGNSGVAFGSLKATINETLKPNEEVIKSSTSGNTFVYSPYESGGSTAWVSSAERTMGQTSLRIKIESNSAGTSGFLNAMVIEKID